MRSICTTAPNAIGFWPSHLNGEIALDVMGLAPVERSPSRVAAATLMPHDRSLNLIGCLEGLGQEQTLSRSTIKRMRHQAFLLFLIREIIRRAV